MKRFAGRLANQLRPFKVEWDPMGFALSSLIICTGKTSVLCSVSVREGVPEWRSGTGNGWLSAEYRLLPGSTPRRKERESFHLSGRTQEIQRFIGRTLRSAVDMRILGDKTLLVDCDVIQADAGTRTAAITGGWIALKAACERLIQEKKVDNDFIQSQLAAVSVGMLNGSILLDLDYSEDSKADVDSNFVMNSHSKFLEVQTNSERAAFTRGDLLQMLDLAEDGIVNLFASQLEALTKRS